MTVIAIDTVASVNKPRHTKRPWAFQVCPSTSSQSASNIATHKKSTMLRNHHEHGRAPEHSLGAPNTEADITPRFYRADARNLSFLTPASVDLVVTSPPYWQKRDYGHKRQIGQECSVEEYIETLVSAMTSWRHALKPTGSIIINVADSFQDNCLVGVPTLLERAAVAASWRLLNRIVWVKDYGVPEAHHRLAQRHEYLLHFGLRARHFIDLFAFARDYGGGFNPGDVWRVHQSRPRSEHLAPFPIEIVSRAITLACPEAVCPACGRPLTRVVERTAELNPNRPQARRAMELFRQSNLTPEHIAAIQAIGISDAGKAQKIQVGAGKNSERVKKLAREAKAVLGGYFREFTFPLRRHVGWESCACGSHEQAVPGLVLDPFMGSGTTIEAAVHLGRRSIGSDLKLPKQTATLGIRVHNGLTKVRHASRARP